MTPVELLKSMFQAAVDAALPSICVPAHLPPRPKGRTVIIGAGKASGAMAKALEDAWQGPLEGLVVTRYGYRVPFVAVSPFARKNYVSHTTADHTSILKFIEKRFGLPALTNRDAAAHDLLDMFDFAGAPWATPPDLSGVPVPTDDQNICNV